MVAPRPAWSVFDRLRMAELNTSEQGLSVHLTRRAAEQARPARERWLADHHNHITAVLEELLAQADRLGLAVKSEPDAPPVLGDYLAWIRDDLADGIDDATLHTLGLVLRGLRTRPGRRCAGAPARHPPPYRRGRSAAGQLHRAQPD